jgi:hypothetical protein
MGAAQVSYTFTVTIPEPSSVEATPNH